ncbi:hypothetical protein FQZ97_1058720 [compost metagenome]
MLHLQHLQGFRVDLGFEAASLGIHAANLIAAIVDLQVLDLPALCGGHLPHSLARLPAIERRIAIVAGPCRWGGHCQIQNQQAAPQRGGVFHGRLLESG